MNLSPISCFDLDFFENITGLTIVIKVICLFICLFFFFFCLLVLFLLATVLFCLCNIVWERCCTEKKVSSQTGRKTKQNMMILQNIKKVNVTFGQPRKLTKLW